MFLNWTLYPLLVLVHRRKTENCPNMMNFFLLGRKISTQTKKLLAYFVPLTNISCSNDFEINIIK